jgi:hypothetical protein
LKRPLVKPAAPPAFEVLKRVRSEKGSFAVHTDERVRSRLLGRVALDRVLDFVEHCRECVGPPVTLPMEDLERNEFCQYLLETHRKIAELGDPSAATFGRIVEQMACGLNRSSS